MTTLRNLLVESAQLEEQLISTCGELTPELEESLALRDIHITSKVANYMLLLDRIEMEADHLYSRGQKFLMASKSLTGLRERLLSRVRQQMIEHGLTELDGLDEKFKLAANKGKLMVSETAEIPKSFFVETISSELDKTKLKDAVQRGEIFSGVSIVPTLTRQIKKRG